MKASPETVRPGEEKSKFLITISWKNEWWPKFKDAKIPGLKDKSSANREE